MAENKNKNVNKPEDDFSIEKELADMKKSLLEDDKQIISDAINEKMAEDDNKAKEDEVAMPTSEEAPVENSKEDANKVADQKPQAKKPANKTTSSSPKKPASKKSSSRIFWYGILVHLIIVLFLP